MSTRICYDQANSDKKNPIRNDEKTAYECNIRSQKTGLLRDQKRYTKAQTHTLPHRTLPQGAKWIFAYLYTSCIYMLACLSVNQPYSKHVILPIWR